LEPLHQAADDGPLGWGEGRRRALRAAGLGQEAGVGREELFSIIGLTRRLLWNSTGAAQPNSIMFLPSFLNLNHRKFLPILLPSSPAPEVEVDERRTHGARGLTGKRVEVELAGEGQAAEVHGDDASVARRGRAAASQGQGPHLQPPRPGKRAACPLHRCGACDDRDRVRPLRPVHGRARRPRLAPLVIFTRGRKKAQLRELQSGALLLRTAEQKEAQLKQGNA
jgi:hypothetical protein